VDQVYLLLWLKENNSAEYARMIEFGSKYTRAWDDGTIRLWKNKGFHGIADASARAVP
jgi:hypothetical protein